MPRKQLKPNSILTIRYYAFDLMSILIDLVQRGMRESASGSKIIRREANGRERVLFEMTKNRYLGQEDLSLAELLP